MSAPYEKIALVTGVSSGIGKALVKELLAQNYEVVGISRSSDKFINIKEEIKDEHFSIYFCDVSDLNSVKQVSAQLQQDKKIPQFFFLNAGIAGLEAVEPTDFLDLSIHQRIFAVNYYGVLNFVEEWLRSCVENGGATFMVTSSINATFAPPCGSAYAASKAAISKAFDGLRLAHNDKNLKFLSVFCGPVDTEGLLGKLPFTWAPEKMAQYMVAKAEKGKAHSNPSWFYSALSKLLNALPEKQVFKIFELFSDQKSEGMDLSK